MRRTPSHSRTAGSATITSNSSRRVAKAGQGQTIVAQPVNERSDVASQPVRLGLGLPSKVSLSDKLVVWIALAGTADPGLQRLAPRRGPLGEVRQPVGQVLALALDVEHVAPGSPLSGAQALPGIGDRVVGPQPLRGGTHSAL